MELEPHTSKDIYKAIIRSQHCQRNWDLSKEIPEEDMKLLVDCATQCPSKQNVSFYNLHYITNRYLIEEIHDLSWGFTTKSETETNSQVLANLLICFELTDLEKIIKSDNIFRNDETNNFLKNGKWDEKSFNTLKRDAVIAVGIAAGYLNLTASLLGYRTGCCQCFDFLGAQKLLKLDNLPILLMGIGYNNDSVNRRQHHIRENFMFPTKEKQPITVKFWQ